MTNPGLQRTADAVIVVPGIMGSELVDETGTVQWGLRPSLLGRAWLTRSMDVLNVTDDDAAGGRRLRPSRLVRFPGYLPILGGLEPYTYLLEQLATRVIDPRALIEFPYDWRLSIDYNAAELVARCERHLESWRRVVAENRYGDASEVRLVIVAHSMGGLVARYAVTELGLAPLVGRLITLGTPYYGAVKAVRMLATGEGAPLPRRAARALALTCPGVHDLLPRYRCWSDGGGLRRITTADLASIGADPDLMVAAADRWSKLLLEQDPAGPVPLHAVVGTDQPTMQTVAGGDGGPEFLDSLNGVDHRGDSTVYRQSAAPAGTVAIPLPQRHGSLAKTREAVSIVIDKLVGADTGPPLGTRSVGADIPDLVEAGQPVIVRVHVAEESPIGVSVTSTALDTGVPTDWGSGILADGDLVFRRSGVAPGLHRVQVKAGGYSGVSDIMLVEPSS